MKKLLFILLLAACQKEPAPETIEYCCDCVEYYSGYYAFPAFCGTSQEVNAFMSDLYAKQVSGKVDYHCTKYINDK